MKLILPACVMSTLGCMAGTLWQGWVVCGAEFLCGQAAEPAAIILPQARDAAGIL